MKISTLKRLIKIEYLRSVLFPLIVIEIMLVIAYFWSNSYVSDATQKALSQQAQINLKEISKRAATVIDLEFKNISSLAGIFAKEHERFFKNFDPKSVNTKNPNYFLTKDGVISNKKDSEQRCTLFFSNIHKDSEGRMEKAIGMQILDPLYNSLLASNQNIVQLYFNSYDSMNRLCPFMDDALAQYPHDIKIPKYNFYYLADQKHNPDKKVVWTEVYLDPAGKGWMMSAIAPVYKKDFLEGVIGLDVTIDKLIKNILSINLPYSSSSMLVDEDGHILAMNSMLEKILKMKELKEYGYDSPIKSTTLKPEEFNLFKNKKDLPKLLTRMIKKNESLKEYKEGTQDYIITKNSIPQTKWSLILLIDKNSLFAGSNMLKNKTYFIGYLAIGGIIIFYFIFLGWLLKRANSFSLKILYPVEQLIDATTKMKDDLKNSELTKTSIVEFNTLLENFSLMSEELSKVYTSMDKQIKASIGELRQKDKHILQQSRQAQMGEMISMIAHQWRQPLSAISTVVAGLKLKEALGKYDLNTQEGQQAHKENLQNSLNKIEEYVRFLTVTIDDFRNFFKPDKKKEEVTPIDMVNKTLNIVKKAFEVNKISLHVENKSEGIVNTYSHEVMQVILNMLKNSEDVFKDKKQTDGYVKIRVYDQDDKVKIEIEDNAGGIPKEIFDKIFEPYFSTKKEKNGSGLGLYMSKTIIEEHCKGKIDVSNTKEGALFCITLPKD